jgi:plasmid stabilization system protein ParE
VKNFQVVILPSAEIDIEDAYVWIAEHDEEAAVRWFNRLMDVISSLETFPERCPLAPEAKFFKAEVREIFHGHRQHKYRVLFILSECEVRIVHVRHGARRALGETDPET